MAEIGLGSVSFGAVAGVLSTLSPCVLPILPLVVGSAIAAHRFGVVALAGGMVLSFTAIGLFVASLGFSIGLDGELFRTVTALVLGAVGIVLLSARLQERFALASSGLGDAGHKLLARVAPSGLGGQFAVGTVLGAVWSPCVGPTLGAASLVAAQGQQLGAAAAVMLAFGVGASIPLVVVSLLSRAALARWRGGMLRMGHGGKRLMGVGTLAVAALILTGLDRTLETALVAISPEWLTRLTTSF